MVKTFCRLNACDRGRVISEKRDARRGQPAPAEPGLAYAYETLFAGPSRADADDPRCESQGKETLRHEMVQTV